MNLPLLIRSLLLSASVLVEAQEGTSSGVMWQSANVRDFIKGEPVEEFAVNRELSCAAEAQKRPWCSLYCYVDNMCSCYDAIFPPSVYPATVNCKTSSLIRLSCSPPFAPILMLEDLGCLYLATTPRSWNASRQDCYTYGADLLVASTNEQFLALNDHFQTANIPAFRWIGIISRKWLDGRSVEEIWDVGEPNGAADATQCGVMQPFSMLDDTYCTKEQEYICQVKLT